jgi:hypothetical protein
LKGFHLMIGLIDKRRMRQYDALCHLDVAAIHSVGARAFFG